MNNYYHSRMVSILFVLQGSVEVSFELSNSSFNLVHPQHHLGTFGKLKRERDHYINTVIVVPTSIYTVNRTYFDWNSTSLVSAAADRLVDIIAMLGDFKNFNCFLVFLFGLDISPANYYFSSFTANFITGTMMLQNGNSVFY